MAKRHTKSARSLGFVEKADNMGSAEKVSPKESREEFEEVGFVNLDEVIGGDMGDVEEVRPVQLFQDSGKASTKERLMLNTIKKLSRDLKRKDEEAASKRGEFEAMKSKSEDMARRIKNSRGSIKRAVNSTPSPC